MSPDLCFAIGEAVGALVSSPSAEAGAAAARRIMRQYVRSDRDRYVDAIADAHRARLTLPRRFPEPTDATVRACRESADRDFAYVPFDAPAPMRRHPSSPLDAPTRRS